MSPPILMIFAAGYGTRMRPITDHLPKPLLEVAGKALIDHHLIQAACAGIEQVVVNVSHLHEQIIQHCGNGDRYGLTIHYSIEPTPMETAAGLINARHLFSKAHELLIINGDIFVDWSLKEWLKPLRTAQLELTLVENPEHNLKGDFSIDCNGQLRNLNANEPAQKSLTFAGISRMDLKWLDQIKISNDQSRGLGYHFRHWVDTKPHAIVGRVLPYPWFDIGTPERLENARSQYRSTE